MAGRSYHTSRIDPPFHVTKTILLVEAAVRWPSKATPRQHKDEDLVFIFI